MAASKQAAEAAVDTAGFEGAGNGRRNLTLSVHRVEVRLYRRSRLSADTVRKPAHFEYILRCDWGEVGSGLWWDYLPKTYTLRRKWAEIAEFHNELVNELAFDPVIGVSRLKRAKAPDFPAKGDLDKFILGVAASGDAGTLNGMKKRGIIPETVATSADADKAKCAEDIGIDHAVYVETRLSPYFADVTKTLAELPTDVLEQSYVFQKFLLDRIKPPRTGKEAPKNFGPKPIFEEMREEDFGKATEALRKTNPELFKRPPSRQDEMKARQAAKEAKAAAEKKAKEARQAKEAATGGATPSSRKTSLVGSPSSPSLPSPFSPVKSNSASSAGDGFGKRSGMASAPTLGSGLMYSTFDSTDRDPIARSRRLASSHYGFFARSLPSSALEEWGHASRRGFWKRMLEKEGKEMGRRSVLRFRKYDSMLTTEEDGFQTGRLPSLPPSTPGDMRQTTDSHQSSSHGRHAKRSATPSILEMSGQVKDGPSRTKICEIREDIREGMHVMILHEAASEEPHNERIAKAAAAGDKVDQMEPHGPRIDEALKIYKKYQELHALDGGGEELPHDHEEDHDHDEEHDGPNWAKQHTQRLAAAKESGMAPDLLPISWPTFFSWVQREYDFASHFRNKTAITAFTRAMKRWKQWQASEKQRFFGVSLNMIYEWTYPGLIYEDLAQIMTWIANYELEHVRQPTPRCLDAPERRQLENIFDSLDTKRQGFVTADDIAGGEVQDISQRLKNIVDADTVRSVCGDKSLTQYEFLELFCDINCRAHEDSKEAQLEDGSILIYVEHPAVGFSGWLNKVPQKGEEKQLRLIDALEAEAMKWKRLASSRKTRLSEAGTML